jgi:pimeloyl-ACP methyl ester carboxylesterase
VAEVRICLIHGAATTARIWDGLIAELRPLLPGARIEAPQRGYSGSLDTEIAALIAPATDALIVGVSGGATLGLELAARGVGFESSILHEPAVGSLLPGLLTPMADAYARDGVTGFATTLYGPSWRPEFGPADPEAVGRDLAMFRGFEPRSPAPGAGPVLTTVGANSPAIRHAAAAALTERLGYPSSVLAGCAHAVHIDQPRVLAALIAQVATS